MLQNVTISLGHAVVDFYMNMLPSLMPFIMKGLWLDLYPNWADYCREGCSWFIYAAIVWIVCQPAGKRQDADPKSHLDVDHHVFDRDCSELLVAPRSPPSVPSRALFIIPSVRLSFVKAVHRSGSALDFVVHRGGERRLCLRAGKCLLRLSPGLVCQARFLCLPGLAVCRCPDRHGGARCKAKPRRCHTR